MFPCEVCKAVFMYISSLSKPLRTKHKGLKDHRLLKKKMYIAVMIIMNRLTLSDKS